MSKIKVWFPLWLTMFPYGWLWFTFIDYFYLFGVPMVGYGWIWLTLVTFVVHGYLWLIIVEYGFLWLKFEPYDWIKNLLNHMWHTSTCNVPQWLCHIPTSASIKDWVTMWCSSRVMLIAMFLNGYATLILST